MRRIEQMRKILETKTAGMIDDQFIDIFSASAYVQIYDALNKEHQYKQESVDLEVAMDRVWKLVDKLRQK